MTRLPKIFQDGLPYCTTTECPKYEGLPGYGGTCTELGHQPERTCIPELRGMLAGWHADQAKLDAREPSCPTGGRHGEYEVCAVCDAHQPRRAVIDPRPDFARDTPEEDLAYGIKLAERLLTKDGAKWFDVDQRLARAVTSLSISVDAHDDASTPAFDEIAAMCGCPEWEYPGQVIRDVAGVVKERDALREKLRVAEAVRDDARAASQRYLNELRAEKYERIDERRSLTEKVRGLSDVVVSSGRGVPLSCVEKARGCMHPYGHDGPHGNVRIDAALKFTGRTVDVDGRVDDKGIRYMDNAHEMSDGTWRCLAVVGTGLCIVEVKITGAIPVIASSKAVP